MITRILTALLVTALSASISQAQEIPKDGAVIALEKTSFNLTPGTSYEQDVTIIRSKKNRKTRFQGLEARTPAGIDINFTEKGEVKDQYVMKIDVAENASQKAYTIVIKGSGAYGPKIKGKVISINVGGEQMVTSGE